MREVVLKLDQHFSTLIRSGSHAGEGSILGNKRAREEEVHPMRHGASMSNAYGSAPMYGSTPPNPREAPMIAGPPGSSPNSKPPGAAPIRHSMMAD